MEIEAADEQCVALLARGALTDAASAAKLVRDAQRRHGLELWGKMELELYPAERGTLILARPSSGLAVEPAAWLAPYING